MADRDTTVNLASRLLRQDESLHSERYKEHRMQLELQLAQAERRLQITKTIIFILLVTVAGLFVVGGWLIRPAVPAGQTASAQSAFGGALHVIASIVFFFGLATFASRFLPSVRRLREELQAESIRELRRDVAELREMLSKLDRQRHDRPPGGG